uniref:Cationic amino acid transporter C-terminal domain-containing protein n=1 Tax=Amphora coffeiformis TaxID=265554 RepID=A0A6S8J0A1_9STRA
MASIPERGALLEEDPPPPPSDFDTDNDYDNDNDNDENMMMSPSGTTTRRHRDRSLSNVSEIFEEAYEILTETTHHVQEEFAQILETEIQPVKPRDTEMDFPFAPHGVHPKLSVLALSILVFYKVSGGPFGCEPTVRAAGPFYALVGFILFPIFWSIPEALVTAELGCQYPEPSGSVAWIEEAFGSTAGLLCGYFHWVSGATDNAIYPALFLEYLSSYLKSLHVNDHSADAITPNDADEFSVFTDPYWRFFLCSVMTVILAYINFTGLQIVGNLSVVVAVLAMSPFVLLVVLGAGQVDPNRWFTLPESPDLIQSDDDALQGATFLPTVTLGGILWRPYVNNLFWNLNSFDVGASFAGELEHPERTFGTAMILSVFLVAASYILPLLVALGASDSDQNEWKAGQLTVVAGEVVGHWLAAWTVLAAAASNLALFLAELSGDAYQLMGMADRGMIPKVFAKRSRFETPTNGIILGTMVILCLSVADFDALVEMLNVAYSVSLLMEFAAFVKFRMDEEEDDEKPEGFRLPFNTFGCILFIIPPCFICLFIMATASKVTYVYVAALVIFGAGFHWAQKAAKHYNWWEYAQAPISKRAAKNQAKAKLAMQ